MIHERAMLMSLNISQWTARKHDSSVSAEVEKTHAANDAGRYNKLLIDKKALEPIVKVVSAARTYHMDVTLPWGDNGDRLLPSRKFLDYTKKMRELNGQFDSAVRAFLTNYPSLIADARKRLGTMYNPDDYPHVSDLATKFRFNIMPGPVPQAKDFRVDVSKEDADRIKDQITKSVEDRLGAATKDCWNRVADRVKKISEKLHDADAIFRDSLIENARELCDLLPALNVTDDPELDKVEAMIRANLLIPPDRLREDKALRSETARKADEILNHVKGLFG